MQIAVLYSIVVVLLRVTLMTQRFNNIKFLHTADAIDKLSLVYLYIFFSLSLDVTIFANTTHLLCRCGRRGCLFNTATARTGVEQLLARCGSCERIAGSRRQGCVGRSGRRRRHNDCGRVLLGLVCGIDGGSGHVVRLIVVVVVVVMVVGWLCAGAGM